MDRRRGHVGIIRVDVRTPDVSLNVSDGRTTVALADAVTFCHRSFGRRFLRGGGRSWIAVQLRPRRDGGRLDPITPRPFTVRLTRNAVLRRALERVPAGKDGHLDDGFLPGLKN